MFDSYDNINAQIHETDKIMNKYSLPLIKSIGKFSFPYDTYELMLFPGVKL